MNAVLAATSWNTNAEMIADCARLGYLTPSDLILDPTYKRGLWWTRWQPDRPVVTSDLVRTGALVADFTSLPFRSDTFDAVTYDPPYISVGGRDTSTIDEYNERYGLHTTPSSPAGLQTLINNGITELHRVLKPRGRLLVKCANYVSSGRLWIGNYYTQDHALSVGFQQIDELKHVGHVRPQPARSRADGGPVRQHHARQNYSTLFVFRKGGRS